MVRRHVVWGIPKPLSGFWLQDDFTTSDSKPRSKESQSRNHFLLATPLPRHYSKLWRSLVATEAQDDMKSILLSVTFEQVPTWVWVSKENGRSHKIRHCVLSVCQVLIQRQIITGCFPALLTRYRSGSWGGDTDRKQWQSNSWKQLRWRSYVPAWTVPSPHPPHLLDTPSSLLTGMRSITSYLRIRISEVFHSRFPFTPSVLLYGFFGESHTRAETMPSHKTNRPRSQEPEIALPSKAWL